MSNVIDTKVVCFNRSDNVLALLREKVQQGLEDCAEALVGHAQGYCPVRTGALRDSIDYEIVDDRNVAIRAGSDEAYYAAYVEFGTSRNVAQPFLRPAKENHKDEMKQIMDAALIR